MLRLDRRHHPQTRRRAFHPSLHASETRQHLGRINILRAEQLIATGQIHPAGLAAFARRNLEKSAVYSFEQPPWDFPTGLKQRFRNHPAAWEFWQQQPPGYRRTVVWWVVSAKQEATRLCRLDLLVVDSAAGRRLNLLNPTAKK